MRRTASIWAVAAGVLTATSAAAFELPADWPITVGGRWEYRVAADRSSGAYPWDYAAGGAADSSRVMLELASRPGRYGLFYLKTAARAGRSGDRFEIEQGDYEYEHRGGGTDLGARLFTNERRYFTGDFTEALLDDDAVTRYHHQYGARVDATRGRFSGTAAAALLGDDWDGSRNFAFLKTAFYGRGINASLSYLSDDAAT